MTRAHALQVERPLLEAKGIDIVTPSGRVLVRGLDASFSGEHVAIVGRNGGGKSTLLDVLVGHTPPHRGSVTSATSRVLVPQDLEPAGTQLTPGELRKLHLLRAFEQRPGLLLLDEPTQDLDAIGVAWLLARLRTWSGGLVVVSHHAELLQRFRHFFVVAESGCRYFPGTFAELEHDLAARHRQSDKKYVRRLNVMLERERHNATVVRRRRRKKNLGRLHEERRAPARAQLHGKKGYAQVSQAKAAKIREARISGARQWALAAREAMTVTLPLRLVVPTLDPPDGSDLVTMRDVSVRHGERTLFAGVDLRMQRDRLAVTGPNGSGKTTLLELIAGRRVPTHGTVSRGRVGYIAQQSGDSSTDETLVERLVHTGDPTSAHAVAQVLVAHQFPLALAHRPLRSLSAGERARATLISVFQQRPAVELLVLDEPTYGLDFVGFAALVAVLKTWRGGLVVASHDAAFLRAVGVEHHLELDGSGGHVLRPS